MRVKRILVPIDFSTASLKALDEAIELSRSLKAELNVVFVLAPLQYPYMVDFLGTAVGFGLMVEEERKWARKEVEKLVARLAKRGVKCRALIEHGSPQERIVETAKRIGADLILMSTHGRTGLSHLMLGSVSERVVRTAPCSVLIVRSAARQRGANRRAPAKRSATAASSNTRRSHAPAAR